MSKKQKILSCALSAALLAGAIPVAVSASNDPHMVRIVVENNTKTEEGTAWSGTLVDKWVELKDDSTAVSLFTELAQSEGFTQTGADSGYITEIGGLSAEGMGGWMFGVDDWYGNSGISIALRLLGTLTFTPRKEHYSRYHPRYFLHFLSFYWFRVCKSTKSFHIFALKNENYADKYCGNCFRTQAEAEREKYNIYEKLTGKSPFKGQANDLVWCGRWETKL